MAAKIIAQIIIQGTAVFSRAFVSAYQQALQNARKGGAANAANMAQSVGKVKMHHDEAFKILNIDRSVAEEITKEAIEATYLKHSANNDPAKGGSFYIQSKIFRAKESIEYELGISEEGKKAKEKADLRSKKEKEEAEMAAKYAAEAEKEEHENKANDPDSVSDDKKKQ